MKLCYRGVNYEKHSTPVQITSTEVVGKYRGAPCKVNHIKVPLMQQLKAYLKYRGIDYQTL